MPAADDTAAPDGRRRAGGSARQRKPPPGFLAARPLAGEGAAHESTARTWVYRHVSGAIVEGWLWPGLRLPSARELSRSWGVARGAVDEALMRLAREGLLERRVGRGSFIARRLPPGMVREVSGRAALTDHAGEALGALAPLLRIGSATIAGAAGTMDRARPMLDPRVPDTDLFPLATWRRCMATAHGEADRSSLCYGLPAGWPPLREATVRHLALTRGLQCRPEQVIILNGPLQALDLVVRVLLEPGDRVVVERPGYMSIARTVGLAPLDLHGAPVDEDGLDVEAARRACPRPALIYAHPLNQYPTGARLSPARRTSLLAWARECGAWVIEGDHLGEIVYDGPVPPPLMRLADARAPAELVSAPARATWPAAAAHSAVAAGSSAALDLPSQADAEGGRQVLFFGTFNGVMFPSLRLSYLVVPLRLVPAFTAVRGLFGDHPPIAPQQALTTFIDGGHLGLHLRRMREVYRRRRDALLAAAATHLPPEVRLGPLLGGTHGCLHLPAGCADEPLGQRLVDAGFAIEILSTYSWPQPGTNGVVLGYGADDVARIEAGMEKLATIVREALQAPAPARARWRGGAAGSPRAPTSSGASRRG